MYWIIIIGIGVFVVFLIINSDYKESVQSNVTNFGGMQVKYQKLINYLEQHPSAKITKIKNDSIVIQCAMGTFWIDSVGQDLEVNYKGYIYVIGNISKTWSFQGGYPQEEMINEIEAYFNWQLNQIKNQ